MYDTPSSMFDICIDVLCTSLSSSCSALPSDTDEAQQKFSNLSIYFPGNIAEQILETLCSRGLLNDKSMMFFQPQITRLQKVNISNTPLTKNGLRVLKSHKICDLKVTGLKNISVNDLIGCLGEWSLSNLRSLNVSHNVFLNDSKFCVIVSLSKLRSLVSLNVSNTDFNTHALEIITADLPNLENIDISETRVNDISSLRRCKTRLKSLVMYNIHISKSDDVVPVLLELSNLRILDISDDFNIQPYVDILPNKYNVVDLLSDECCFPHIIALDISGKEDINEKSLLKFLSQHTTLKFLGLALTDACHCTVFTDRLSPDYSANIVVTGDASESQILECLRRYTNRWSYIHKSLFNLFGHTSNMTDCREDIIILVTSVMKLHSTKLGVQMSATACLYNLTKGPLSQKVHPTIMSEVVSHSLDAMQNFPSHAQLQKNALLTLCTDRVLQQIVFDKYRCALLVMNCLSAYDDPSMTRMAVAICAILAAKISTDQTASLGALPRNMKKLLFLVRQRLDPNSVISIDVTLKFTLSALWNLTDESPPTCNMFLMENGLELFMSLLDQVRDLPEADRVPVETKVLGLLNNISEVPSLRHFLLREDFMMIVNRLLNSSQLDISYFAAGIVAYLTSDSTQLWTLSTVTRNDLLEQLTSVVLSWKQPESEMVAYRSFNPFFPLLTTFDTPPVQLWAVWAVHHVCIRSPLRYCQLLVQQGGLEILKTVANHSSPQSNVYPITQHVLQLIAETLKN